MTTEYYNGVICPMDLEPLDIEREDDLTTTSITITKNGTTTLTPPDDKIAFSSITVTTDVPPDPIKLNAICSTDSNSPVYPLKTFTKITSDITFEQKEILLIRVNSDQITLLHQTTTSAMAGYYIREVNPELPISKTLTLTYTDSDTEFATDSTYWNSHIKLKNNAPFYLSPSLISDLPN